MSVTLPSPTTELRLVLVHHGRDREVLRPQDVAESPELRRGEILGRGPTRASTYWSSRPRLGDGYSGEVLGVSNLFRNYPPSLPTFSHLLLRVIKDLHLLSPTKKVPQGREQVETEGRTTEERPVTLKVKLVETRTPLLPTPGAVEGVVLLPPSFPPSPFPSPIYPGCGGPVGSLPDVGPHAGVALPLLPPELPSEPSSRNPGARVTSGGRWGWVTRDKNRGDFRGIGAVAEEIFVAQGGDGAVVDTPSGSLAPVSPKGSLDTLRETDRNGPVRTAWPATDSKSRRGALVGQDGEMNCGRHVRFRGVVAGVGVGRPGRVGQVRSRTLWTDSTGVGSGGGGSSYLVLRLGNGWEGWRDLCSTLHRHSSRKASEILGPRTIINRGLTEGRRWPQVGRKRHFH